MSNLKKSDSGAAEGARRATEQSLESGRAAPISERSEKPPGRQSGHKRNLQVMPLSYYNLITYVTNVQILPKGERICVRIRSAAKIGSASDPSSKHTEGCFKFHLQRCIFRSKLSKIEAH